MPDTNPPKQPETPEQPAQKPARPPEVPGSGPNMPKFNPFTNEDDMFKIVLGVGGFVLLVAVVAGLVSLAF